MEDKDKVLRDWYVNYIYKKRKTRTEGTKRTYLFIQGEGEKKQNREESEEKRRECAKERGKKIKRQ